VRDPFSPQHFAASSRAIVQDASLAWPLSARLVDYPSNDIAILILAAS
jgi:hypothetical protein